MTTFADVEQSIRTLAAENPDFIYTPPVPGTFGKCQYVHNGEGSCIVGKACVANGASIATLDHFDNGEGTNGDQVVEAVFGIPLTPAQRAWIKTVQRRQDNGVEWGEAVQEADDTFPLT